MKNTLREQLNYCKKSGWFPLFEQAAKDHQLELSMLLAIASRETNIRNIIGDAGHGRGIMQIDDRSHKEFLRDHHNNGGLNPETNIDYGASVLAQNLKIFRGNYANAIAAYNTGTGNVKKSLVTGKHPDTTTAHGNYGADVINRASIFKELIAESE
ncbi:MAG: Lytic transglycosylase catalytic [bacterium]|nr:MAG: Lytic transglycosylase catalytic [bacterium]